VTAQEGDARIPSFGGSNSDQIESVAVPGAVTTGTAQNKACGSLTNAADCAAPPGSSPPYSAARATVQSVNLLAGAITADVLDVSCQSFASGGDADTTFSSTLVDVTINGQPIIVDQPPNSTTTIPLPDGHVVTVILNEQIENSSNGMDTDGEVNAIHVFVKDSNGDTQGEVIVAHAHCDAHKTTE
jgi:hypothetical protein